MQKVDDKIEESIIKIYREDKENIGYIKNEYDLSKTTIYNILSRNNVSLNNSKITGKRIFTDEQEEKIAEKYIQGLSYNSLAKKYETSIGCIQNILGRQDIEGRDHSEANRDYSVNHDSFEELDNETKYWIGFLLGDGSIKYHKSADYNRNPTVQLKLQNRDIDHIQKFVDYLSYDGIIEDSDQNCSVVRITSKKLVNDIEKHIVTKDKKYKADIKNSNLLNSRDFWRGLVDADGCLYEGKDNIYGIQLTGTKEVCDKFKSYVKDIVNTSASVRNVGGKTHNFKVGGTNFPYKIVKDLYLDAVVYLDRKYNRGNKMIKEMDKEDIL